MTYEKIAIATPKLLNGKIWAFVDLKKDCPDIPDNRIWSKL
jgi:hypothetical protein